MKKIIEKVDSINKTILRGCNTYVDFLNLLKDLKAPLNKEDFFNFFINSIYVEDDLFALICLIEQNKEKFNYLKTGEVLKMISDEIFEDYLNI